MQESVAMTPRRIQLSRAKGFNLQAASIALNGLAAVNVARPSPWGNPFIIGEDGTRAYCIHLFRFLLAGHIAITTRAPVAAQRAFVVHAGDRWKSLKGKNLACWCSAQSACHADVLLELANLPALCEAL
jgi:hypothetical protein